MCVGQREADRVSYLGLDERGPLCPQEFHRLEYIHDAFVSDPLENDAQREEHARSTGA